MIRSAYLYTRAPCHSIAAKSPFLELYTTFRRTEEEPLVHILEEPVEGTPLVVAALFARAAAPDHDPAQQTVVTLRVSYLLASASIGIRVLVQLISSPASAGVGVHILRWPVQIAASHRNPYIPSPIKKTLNSGAQGVCGRAGSVCGRAGKAQALDGAHGRLCGAGGRGGAAPAEGGG